GDAVAVLPLFDRRLPSELPGFHVDRYDVGVELAEKQQALAHGETAVDPAAAHRRDFLVDPRPVSPRRRWRAVFRARRGRNEGGRSPASLLRRVLGWRHPPW